MKNIKSEIKINTTFPALAVRGLVVFPGMVMHFDVARAKSNEALKAALAADRKIFLVTQRDLTSEDPKQNDLFAVGVVAEIRQVLKTPDNVTRVLVEGLRKARLVNIAETDPYMIAEVKPMPTYAKSEQNDIELTALVRAVKDIFDQYAANMPKMPPELYANVMGENDPYKLFENITFNVSLQAEDKQQLLEAPNITMKLGLLLTIISREVEVLDVEREIQQEVREQIDRGQREYYLREQMKVISGQLGEEDNYQDDAYNYLDRITDLELPEEVETKLIKEADRLLHMAPSSQEAFVIHNYLDTCLELPWNMSSRDKADVKKAKSILDHDHYGLNKVKDRILETIAVRMLAPDVRGQIICLVGPPGIGKTSIGKSIARALGKKYARVSLGGIKDESDIRGHRKTYIGSMPGRIITALKTAGTNNPLILLDEIDKMSNDFRGDPSSAMLEVLDSEQNAQFRDHYIEVPFDLSKVLFVTTANTTSTIAPPLLDRMEVIELTSYTREEKFHIAKEHLLSKQLGKNGLRASTCRFADDALYAIIDSYTREAGVRSLERTISSLCRKAAKELVESETKKVIFTAKNIGKYLGAEKFLPDEVSGKNEIGIVNGLAWTSVGGVIMPLEVLPMEGKGTIEMTGSLGDVMKESAKLAVSYVRSVAEKYNIDKNFYKEKDLHIHAPEGAVPKDGPSAGVAMTTAIISALAGIPVRCDVAMTGEITLHGKVLPIGGLREKTMAAYKAGMKTVIIPKKNKADLEEVDDVVKNALSFVFADNLTDVLDVALQDMKPLPSAESSPNKRGRPAKQQNAAKQEEVHAV